MPACNARAVERGGVLIYGRYADSLFLDPVLNDANVDIWILSNLYDTLLLPTDDGKGVQPGLATEWKVSDDGLSVTLTLREGIKFSDGSPITAEDVQWSLDRARDPEQRHLELSARLDRQDVDDRGRSDRHPQAQAPRSGDPAGARPSSTRRSCRKKPFEAAAGATDEEKAKAFAEHPIGSGPFVLKSWQRGSTMKLVTQPELLGARARTASRCPISMASTFEIIPDDATRILKLQSGEIDGAEFIPYARVAELKADPTARHGAVPLDPGASTITFNVRPQLDGKDNPLSNAKVRQAMNYATDKDAIIQIVTHDVGTPMTSFMSIGHAAACRRQVRSIPTTSRRPRPS